MRMPAYTQGSHTQRELDKYRYSPIYKHIHTYVCYKCVVKCIIQMHIYTYLYINTICMFVYIGAHIYIYTSGCVCVRGGAEPYSLGT